MQVLAPFFYTCPEKEILLKYDSSGANPTIGVRMAGQSQEKKIPFEELMVSTLAMTDALAKLLIEKGIITDAEFKAQLSTERASYLAVLKRMH